MFPLVLHLLQCDCVEYNVSSMWMYPSVTLQLKMWQSYLPLQMWRYCWCNSDMSTGSCKNTTAVLLCDSLHLWSSSQHCEWCYCQPSNQSFSWTSPLSEVSVPGTKVWAHFREGGGQVCWTNLCERFRLLCLSWCYQEVTSHILPFNCFQFFKCPSCLSFYLEVARADLPCTAHSS